MHSEKTETRIQIAPGPAGFRYFWAKQVTGFNPGVHCYSCLKGRPVRAVNLELAKGGQISIPVEPCAMIYMCGVANPRAWANNFHLAFRVVPGATCDGRLHTGAEVVVMNGEHIPFDGEAARRLFPDRGLDFHTCRNFQFAAQMFGDGSAIHGTANFARSVK